MKRTIIFAFAAALLGAGACSEQGLPTYGDGHYVYFTEKSDEIVRFSFKTTPGEDTRTIRLAVETVTRTTDRTMSYRLEIDPAKTTAPSEAYDLDPNPVIQAGMFTGETYVTIHRTAVMDEKEVDIAVRIVEGGDFLPGPTTNCLRIIRVSNIISQPDWWNQDFADAFLGTYSNKKYEEFIKATGVSDLSEMDNSEITALCREFVYYLREQRDLGNEIFDEDGSSMLDGININA